MSYIRCCYTLYKNFPETEGYLWPMGGENSKPETWTVCDGIVAIPLSKIWERIEKASREILAEFELPDWERQLVVKRMIEEKLDAQGDKLTDDEFFEQN